MAGIDSALLVKQLQQVLASFDHLSTMSRQNGLSDLSGDDIHRIITQSRAAIIRITGNTSPYAAQAADILDKNIWDGDKARNLTGVVEALKEDLEAGYMQTTEELIHGELFSDFLEMASHLLEEGYKDPAAVVGGASLEGHLRQLAKKQGIETTTTTASGVRPKKLSLSTWKLLRLPLIPSSTKKMLLLGLT